MFVGKGEGGGVCLGVEQARLHLHSNHPRHCHLINLIRWSRALAMGKIGRGGRRSRVCLSRQDRFQEPTSAARERPRSSGRTHHLGSMECRNSMRARSRLIRSWDTSEWREWTVQTNIAVIP